MAQPCLHRMKLCHAGQAQAVAHPCRAALPGHMPTAQPKGPQWWTGGTDGYLSPWAQARVFALIAVSEELGLNLKDHQIAAKVEKVGGGSPSHACIAAWRATLASDPDWYPGKTKENRKRPGPKPLFTGQKKRCVAEAAMALKRQGIEPSYNEVVHRAPRAMRNPETGEPFTQKYVMDVFRTLCYDDNPVDPWGHIPPYQKTALSPDLIAARGTWGRKMQALGHTANWYSKNVISVDPCSTIVPGGPRSVFHHNQALAGKGKRWMSKGVRKYSRNLRAAPFTNKQRQWGDGKLWWFIVLTRGVVRLHVMDDSFAQTGEGMAAFIGHLPAILDEMLGADALKPRVIMSDRGPGFYQSSRGVIVDAYREALSTHSFRPFAGEDGKWQPADLADLFMHETVAAWVRRYFRKHPVVKSEDLETNRAAVVAGLRACERHINNNYDVRGLCSSMPERLDELLQAEGDRLPR